MNTTRPEDTVLGLDQISRAYREAEFDEEPSPALDRAILAKARGHRRPLASYIPPLALAATVVLSVSLVLRSGVLNENAEILSDLPSARSPVITVPTSVSRNLNESIAVEVESISQDAPAESADVEAYDALDALEAFNQPATLELDDNGAGAGFELTPRVADLEDIVAGARRAQPEFREEAADEPQPALSVSAQSAPLAESAAAATKLGCVDADRGQPDDWLACISASLELGLEQEAREELTTFSLAYPDYELPEDLSELQVP